MQVVHLDDLHLCGADSQVQRCGPVLVLCIYVHSMRPIQEALVHRDRAKAWRLGEEAAAEALAELSSSRRQVTTATAAAHFHTPQVTASTAGAANGLVQSRAAVLRHKFRVRTRTQQRLPGGDSDIAIDPSPPQEGTMKAAH